MRNKDDKAFHEPISVKQGIDNEVIEMSQQLVLPYVEKLTGASPQEKAAAITKMIVAMVYSQAVFCCQYLDETSPEEFGEQIGSLVEHTVRELRRREALIRQGRTAADTTESDWD